MATDALHIEPAVLKAFRDAVYARHGRLYGTLRAEATAAIKAHTERLLKGA